MRWSKKHDKYIVNEEINQTRRNKWRREFDRAILFVLLGSSVVGGAIGALIYHLSNK